MATLKMATRVKEVLTGVPAGLGQYATADQADETMTLTPTSTPPLSLLAGYNQAIAGGGTMDIDLTAAQGTTGAVDGTGKKLRYVFVSVPADALAAVVIAAGPSNGYPFNGSASITIPIGGCLEHYFKDGLVAIDSTHKVLRVTGNAADIPLIQLGMG
jgi:hypothetical protein